MACTPPPPTHTRKSVLIPVTRYRAPGRSNRLTAETRSVVSGRLRLAGPSVQSIRYSIINARVYGRLRRRLSSCIRFQVCIVYRFLRVRARCTHNDLTCFSPEQADFRFTRSFGSVYMRAHVSGAVPTKPPKTDGNRRCVGYDVIHRVQKTCRRHYGFAAGSIFETICSPKYRLSSRR